MSVLSRLIATGHYRNEGVPWKTSFALAVCILHFRVPLPLTGAKQDLIHGLTESFGLEKTFKITKSSHSSSTVLFMTNPHPKCHIHVFSELFQALWVHHLSRQPVPMFYMPFYEKISSSIPSRPPLVQFDT